MPAPDKKLERQLIGFKAVEGAERSVRLSFSSEDPYVRWFGPEILDHSEGAVDLSRLNEIGVLLFNHKSDMPIGPVKNAWIENGRGEAEVSFDEDPEADKIFQKVKSGTLKGASLMYGVDNWEEVAAGKKSACGRFTGPCYIARKWTVYEISIVSVPADATVGVGRGINIEEEHRTMQDDNKVTVQTVPAASSSERAAEQTATQSGPTEEQIRTAERQRVTEITTLCREFEIDPAEHITKGSAVDAVRAAVIEQLKKNRPPVSVGMEVVDETDKIRAVVRDGMLLRGGIQLAKPAEGANEFRSMSLRELAIYTLQRDGRNVDMRIDNEDLLRQFFTPGASFPIILDDTVNAAYIDGYKNAPSTVEIWTTRGTLTDFKPSKGGYFRGNAGEFLLVPETGELKHDIPTDTTAPTRALKTYGRQFTLSRQAFINDDVGLVTGIPAQYAAAAKRTINKQVYTILTGNPAMPDGVNVFDSTRGNYVSSGTAPSLTNLQVMILLMALQTDVNGEPLALVPRYVLVPVGLGDTVRQIIASTTIAVNVNGVITNQTNPLNGRGLEPVEDPYLNILGDAIEWYLIADKTSAPFIQIDYLNGQEIPTIRRMEAAGQLGFIWDIYLDWAVTVMEPMAAVKNEGSSGE